ncbi:MAG: hypothetical protein ACYC7E_08720 [Armatimonadota bacterium]
MFTLLRVQCVCRYFSLIGILWGCFALPAFAAPIAQFSIEERFGVSHPDQLLFLPIPRQVKQGEVTLVDGAGKPVQSQVLANNTLTVRTDLPAGEKRAWTLQPGKPPALPVEVKVTQGNGYTEITNALIGIRVPTVPADLAQTPTPIQGLRFQDGTWTAVGPYYMPRPAKSMTVDFLEQGPLLVRIKVSYVFDRALLKAHRPELPVIPAGEGPYSVTIEVQAGQPSIMFEEECEVDISYKVDISNGQSPDRAQYRGHHANSPTAGRDPEGNTYNYYNKRYDALVDLDYSGKVKERWSNTSLPYMSHWDPWGVNTGFYWQLYDAKPDGSDNLCGIFAGPASRLSRPGLSGVSFDTTTVDGKRVVSLQVRFQRLMPTQYYSTHMRFGWGLFLGKKSIDLKPPREVQGINKQMNIHSGINLNTVAFLPATYPDPVQGYGNLYASSSVWKKVAEELRAEREKGGNTLFNQQYQSNPYFKPMLEVWASPTPESAKKAADEIATHAKNLLDTLVNTEGIYNHSMHYFMAASTIASYLVWTDMLLGMDLLTPEQRTQVKQAAALFGMLMWNEDFTPTQPDSGMNMGPANMFSMWTGTRCNYTIFLAQHPDFQQRADSVRKEALQLLNDYTNEEGACTASAHYTGASMVPILNLLQQMQMARVYDAFAEEPRLERYAEWEMQLLTPPEVRFGGLRKIIPVGDGSTEQSTRIGQIGTGMAQGKKELSARLMGAWQAMGRPQDNFFGASMLKIDPSLPTTSPNLGDAQFKGWLSVLRHGWETPDETAVFFINGGTLTDHRHNDNGSLVIYALGAPLSTDWGPIYYPRVAGGYMHSFPIPESLMPKPWDSDNTSLDLPSTMWSTWWNTVHEPFIDFSDSASTAASFTAVGAKDMGWRRVVRSLRADPAHPVIVINDTFTGNKLAGKPVISTLNLMAQGEVATPAGPVKPEERFYHCQDKTKQQLPSAGTPFDLPAGLQRLSFTGQWIIDWDLYVDSGTAMKAAIGNWGHNWHPSTETNQFQRSQKLPFKERQHILRLRGQDRIRMLILPYRKGERPANYSVEKQGDKTLIRLGDMMLTLGENSCAVTRGARKSLTTYDDQPAEVSGMRVAGGPVEIILDATGGTLTCSGAPGPRKITLPAGWRLLPTAAVSKTGEEWTVSYASDKPLVLKLMQMK